MAEEDETTNNDEAEGQSARKRLKMMLIMVVGALLVAGLSVGLTWFFLKDSGDVDEDAMSEENGEETAEMAEEEQQPPAQYLAIQPAMIVNYQVGARTRFLQLELTLVARDAETVEAANTHMPLIRDRLLEVLSNHDYEALQTREGKEQLITALTTTVQEVLTDKIGRPGVESVLFRSFVMQ